MTTKLILALSLFSIISVNAQDKRTIGDYSKLNVSGALDVNLVSGLKEVRIKTDDSKLIQYIKTEVDKGTLNIYIEKGKHKLFRNQDVNIDVPYDKLEEILLSGSGSVTSNKTITTDNIKINLTGSGDIDVSLDAKNVEGSVDGSGDLKLKGKTQNFKGEIVGSGDLEASGLIGENTEIKVVGSGDAEVYAAEHLKARVEGSGDIVYKGNPKTEDTKVSGSGSVEKK